ncbi:hypothetical protein BC833DRAFT_619974 [Globomyces pollinis-pini]|nr:hypothetical protein BC833DRAFT_619974 [Globomyces pollinis-pini]
MSLQTLELPPAVAAGIVRYIDVKSDTLKLLLVCKVWSKAFTTALYENPLLENGDSFEMLLGLLNTPLPFYPYAYLIQKLDFVGSAADNIFMGDLDACLKQCVNIRTLRLERCFHISNILIQSISKNCPKLEQLDLPGCPVSDTFLPQLARNCQKLKRVDLSFTNMTIASLYHLVSNCPEILEIDLSECKPSDRLPDPLGKKVASPLQYLNLRNSPVNDPFVRYIASQCGKLKTLILESCTELTDASLMKVANSCPDLVTLDLSFCDLMTDLSLQVFAIRASTGNGGSLQELHLSACDSITPAAVYQLVQKCTKLELLVLDGCEKMSGTYIKRMATYQSDDITCTYEAKELRKLASIPLKELLAEDSNASYSTPPQSPPKTSEELPAQPATLSRKKSRSILSRRSMINITSTEEAEGFIEAAFEDRAERIRHKRLSRPDLLRKPSETSLDKARRISMRRSMMDMSINSTPAKFISPETVPENEVSQPTSWLPNSTFYPEPSEIAPTETFVETKLNWNSEKTPKPRPQSITALNPNTAAFKPAEPVQPAGPTLLASGRRQRPQSMITPSTSSSTDSNPSKMWGTDPKIWTNPTQLTANSSTWSNRNSISSNNSGRFVDPWANPVTTSAPATKVGYSMQSANPDIQHKVENGWGSTPTQPDQKVFQYSGTNRGRMLIKLKIETRTGGHQQLVIHEYDDPTKLATEFCAFWNMTDFKAPLVRLITIRKNNALRSKPSYK